MAEKIVTSAAVKLASKSTESAYDLLKQQISYVFKYQSYINNLKNQVEDLRMKRETVEKPVQSAERQGEEIYELVKNWLGDVDEFTKTVAKAIIEDEDKANKGGCFKSGSCPNLIQRYKLGKEAAKAAVTGADLLAKGNFSSVSYRPVLQRTESMYVRGYEAFDSREQVFQEIMDTLKDGNVNIIGVYGMGGVGKTTLVKKIAWQVKQDKLFHEVVFAEVTPTPDNKKIQEKLAVDLGLEFRQENEYERAGLLRKRIKNEKNLLIILDNIWTKLDLDAIGIPLGDAEKERRDDNIKPCTILLTSRKRHVLSKDMKTQKNILVDTLSDDDAWKLFRKIVGDSAESSDFHPLAIEFVTKCSGLPLAISTIANTLKNESLHVWKDALAQLKRSNPRHIPDMEESVCSTIELSYNFLKDEEAKSLFLLCTLRDVGSRIVTSDLLKYGMGLNLFGGVYSLEEGRNRLHRLIDYLKASCLLLEGDYDYAVKMHDIIHAVAVSIASTEKFMFNIQNVTGLKEILGEKTPKESTAISLPYRDIHYKLPQRLEFPKLKFLLFVQNRSLQLPDNFFEEMKELRVLDLTGFLFFSLPSSFSCLKNLKTLCLDNCLLEDLRILGELSKLEILSFLDSDIEQLPTEIGQLTRLKLLDLRNCLNLKYIAPNVISCLSQLEELYMDNNLVQWEDEGVDNQRRRNASLEELKQLSNLTVLHLHVQDARVMPQDLFFKKLKSYKIVIGYKWKWLDKYDPSSSRILTLKINDSIYLRHGIKSLLKMTEDLSLEGIKGLRNVLYEINADGFPHLRHLHVKDCLDILYIINSVARNQAFLALETLILCNLINLEKICHGQLNAGSFSILRIIKIENCDTLEYLFEFSIVKNLMQLQEVKATDCKKLKEIFAEESNEINNEIELNQLSSLTLQRLPEFINISSGMSVILPRLENLKLCSINFGNTWLDRCLAMLSYGECLKSLIMEECNGLKFLFSPSMVKSLNQLQKLVVSNCESMEVVINSKGVGEEKIVDMSFPNLLYMKLELLPELTSFGTGNLIEFPSLKELHIERCSNLKTFLSKSLYTNMMREEVNSDNYFIDPIPLFDEKVAFPRLEEMVLLQLDNLQLIWHNEKLHAESFCKLKVVRVESCEKLLVIVPSNTGRHLTFHKLERLDVVNCWSIKSLIPVSVATGLVQLKELRIISCGLEEIISEEEVNGAPTFSFPQLEKIILQDLPELKCFYLQLHAIEWPLLRSLFVLDCKKIKVYASEFLRFQDSDRESQLALFSLEKVIPNLEEFGLDTHDFKLTFLHSDLAESFSKLKLLRLLNFDDEFLASVFVFLRKLNCLETLQFRWGSFKELFPYEKGHICKQDFRGDALLQNLQTLEVWHCHCLTILMPFATSFNNLETLEAHNCDRLAKVLTCEAAKTLANLEKLIIRDCKSVTEVIANEGDKEEEIVFGKLKVLELYSLSDLTCFCSANYSFKFPCLKRVFVCRCPRLNIFSRGALNTPLLKKVLLREEDNEKEYLWKDDLNSTIQQIFTDMVVFCDFEHLTLSEFPNLKEKMWSGQLPVDLFWNLKSLVVDKFSDISSGISPNALCHFKNLEMLDIQSCESLEQVFDLEDNHHEISGLQKLKSLKIDNCKSLRCIFTHSILFGLVQLQEIEVKNCALIEEIIKKEGEKDEVSDKIIIPRLNSVTLKSLPNLRSFYSGSNILECPPLKTIVIKDCQKIEMKEFSIHLASFFTEKVESPTLGSSACFQNLTILVINGFDHLKYLFPSSMVKSLNQLQKLVVGNCKSMEVVIDSKGVGEEKIIDVSLPKLLHIKLELLPELISFGTGNLIEFPLLKKLHIERCSNLKTFFSKSFYPNTTREEVNSENNFIDTIPLFHEKVAFPRLEEMVLLHLDNLQLIWHNEKLHVESFCKLKVVRVESCEKLLTIVLSNTRRHLTFHNLERLHVQNCWSMKSLIPVSAATGLVQLKVLRIISCGLEEIISEEEVNGAPTFSFPQLREITLQNLPKLKCFYPRLHAIDWPMLSSLCAFDCWKIKLYPSKFPSFQDSDRESQPALFLLEKVIPNLEEFGLDTHDFKLTFLHSDLAESFSKLKLLRLQNFDDEFVASVFVFLQRLNCLETLQFVCGSFKELLPCEKGHIWKQDFLGDVSLQNLQTLAVWHCHCLTILMPSATSFNNLETLVVGNCNGLDKVLTCEAIKTLVNLKKLRIRDCKLLTEAIANEGDKEKEIVFDRLKVLVLYCLSNLTCFCSANYSFKFPSLEQVVVSQCPRLNIFSQGALSTPLLKKLLLIKGDDSKEYFWKDDLNSTIQQIFTDMIVFRDFEHLTLFEFPNLKEKLWSSQLPIDLFWNLKSLVVDKFSDISSGISPNVLCHFKNLEMLDVQSCESLEQVFDVKENQEEILGLKKLKSLKIDNCNSLRCVFTHSILLGLVQLQEIEVKNCALIEEIIKKEGEKDGVSDKIIIPRLNSVKLMSLPNLTSFYLGSNILEGPPLKTIVIKDCQKVQMKEFSIHLAAFFTETVELPTLGSSSYFQNLTILVIDGFDQLKYLFPSYTMKSFFKLKELEISNCMFMERVIDADEGRTRTMLFPKLYQLKLRDLPKLTTFCNSTANFVEMSSLFRLWIENCPGIQTFIFSSVCGDMTSSSKQSKGMSANENSTQLQSLFDKKVRLPSLEQLQISYADQLVKLWNDEVSLDSFCKLNCVSVRFCKRLVSIFPSKMLGSHQKLHTLEVQNCDSVKEIFEVLEKNSGMVEEIVPKEEAIPRFVFSKLTRLNLQMLPSLKSFFPEIHISEWPDLEVLKVHGCNNVKIFASELLSIRGSHGDSQQTLFSVYKDAFPSLEELELCEMPGLLHLWRGNSQPSNVFQNLKTLKVSECGSLENSWPSSVSFQNLETLQVSKCDGLRYLLTPSKAKTLGRLTRMNVSDCKMMEEIITHLGGEIIENSIVFSKLDCLELHCLGSLSSFCCGDYTLEFPSLKKVVVRKCLEMETFCHGVLSTPKLQRLQFTEGEDEVEECWEGDLNSTLQYLFKNKNVRISKED